MLTYKVGTRRRKIATQRADFRQFTAEGIMAKKKKSPPAPGKLAGKAVAFVGKFGYSDMFRTLYEKQVVREGGTVVDTDQTAPDYLFVGEGRGGKPPGDVAKIQKKAPAVTVLGATDFLPLLVPSPERLMLEIAKGRRGDFDRFWDELGQVCRQAGVTIDLREADLRKTDLHGAHLEGVDLTGADLRDAKAEYTHFGALGNVNFDDCFATNVYFQDLKNCTFRRAALEHAWLFYNSKNAEGCDFSHANMQTARAERGTFADCKFVSADLSDAEIESSVFVRADFSKADLSRVHACEAKFDGAIFARANLSRADLRKASLCRADLRNANLREAVLSDADLTGANVDGADFQGAVLTGANVAGLDVSKAKNFKPPVARVAGPKVVELAAAAAGSKQFETGVEVDIGKGEFAKLKLAMGGRRADAWSMYRRDENEAADRITAPTFEQGMLNLADRWPNAVLRLDTVTAKGSRTVRGRKLQDLATAAWAEAFGIDATSAEALRQQKQDQIAANEILREVMLAELRGGRAGVDRWNARSDRERSQIGPLNGLDLKRAKLNGAKLDKCDLAGTSFEGASLRDASFWSSTIVGVSFSHADLSGTRFGFARGERATFDGASLVQCSMSIAYLDGATFRKANLTNAALDFAKISGADFTGADLTGVNFKSATYDSQTRFPEGFVPDPSMTLIQPPPPVAAGPALEAGSLDFDTFLQQLNAKVESARMEKAGSMLKAERFQLFAEVKAESLVGVVKSQSNKDLVYSCRLAADGAFGCCTQNLRPCGGLRGALCKHLLVLVVGLAKAGQLDAATVDHWIDLSRGQKPAIDEDAMTATFLRFKGAEAGEVDWRPTETIPEDFYAM